MATVITQELARDLRGPLLPIDDSGFDLRSHKMKHHSDGHQEGDVTKREIIDWARMRARGAVQR